MPSGYGVLDVVLNKTGFGKAGLVGSGPGDSADVETGFGTVGTAGFGVSERAGVTYTKTGVGIVGGVDYGEGTYGSGLYGVGGLIGSGADAFFASETGYATVGTVGSGPSASAEAQTGYATAGLVGSGSSSSLTQETGFGLVGTVGSGVKIFVSGSGTTYTKAGFATAGLVGSGSSASLYTKTGYGNADSGLTASDDFNRANGDPGANWAAVDDGGMVIASSDHLEGVLTPLHQGSRRVGETYHGDHWASIQPYGTIEDYKWIGPSVRMQADGDGAYVFLYQASPGAWRTQIYKRTGAVWTGLGTQIDLAGPYSTSDTLKLEAQGTTLTAYVNDVVQHQLTDTDHSGGAPGAMCFDQGRVDNWSAGSISGLIGSGSYVFISPGTVYTKSGFGIAGGITGYDDFNRADGGLGANWTRMTVDAGTLLVDTNQVHGSVGNPSGAYRTAETYAGDHFSSVEAPASALPAGGWIGAAVRVRNNGGDFYLGIYYFNSPNYELLLYKRVGGSSAGGYTQLGSTVTLGTSPVAAGTVFKLLAVGSSISFLQDGVAKITVTDTTHAAGGAPGIQTHLITSLLDNWAGADDVDNSGFGASASVTQETAAGIAGTVGSGSSTSITQETGAGVAGTVGSGPSASIFQSTGFAAVGTVGSGPGTKSTFNTYTKAGFGTSGLVGSGADAAFSSETGYGVPGLVGSGARAEEHTRAGRGVAGLVGSGADALEDAETGFGKTGTTGSGADATTYVESGFGTVGTVGSGPGTKSTFNTYTKAGFATAGLVGSGPSASITQESGYGQLGLVGSGARASTYTKAGFGKIGLVASGEKIRERTKTGFGTAGLVASGSRIREHPRQGVGVLALVGSGSRANIYAEAGYGKVGVAASGDKDMDVFFTLLDEIRTGHFAGSENGHPSDTVAGVVEEDHEEDVILV